MSALAERLRAAGCSEERLFAIGLATRSGDLPDTINNDELALAAQYDKADAFERVRIRASSPEALARGRDAVRAIDAWVAAKKIKELHGFKK